MARAYFNWLPDDGAGDSGTVPVKIRRIERQDDIAGRHRETGREAFHPERRESQGFIEDGAVLAPRSARGQDAEELAGETILRQTAGLAARVDDQDPVAAPPRRIAPAQGLEGAERSSAAANVAAFRIGDDVPGDVARQIAVFGAAMDLLAVDLGLGLRPRCDDDGGPPRKPSRGTGKTLQEDLVGALTDAARFDRSGPGLVFIHSHLLRSPIARSRAAGTRVSDKCM